MTVLPRENNPNSPNSLDVLFLFSILYTESFYGYILEQQMKTHVSIWHFAHTFVVGLYHKEKDIKLNIFHKQDLYIYLKIIQKLYYSRKTFSVQ